MVPAKTWRVHVGMARTEGQKLRRQLAAAAGKKGHDPLYPFSWSPLVLGVVEDLSTLATQYWAEGVRVGKWPVEQKEVKAFEVQTWRQATPGSRHQVPLLTYLGFRTKCAT